MTHTSDDKLSALETLTGNTGHVDDLENEWLLSVVSSPNGVQTQDLWKQLMVEAGVTAGHINDMFYEWLGTLGYTGSLSDRLAQYWAAGGGGVGSGYSPLMMTYDGATGYYSDASITTAGNKQTLVCRFNIASFAGGGRQRLFHLRGPSTSRFIVDVMSNDFATATYQSKIYFTVLNSAGTAIGRMISNVTVTDSTDHTCFISYDADTGAGNLIIDGADVDDTGHADRLLNTGTMDTGASSSVYVGAASTPTFYIDGEIGFFGYREAYLTNYTDFMTGANPKELDESGWTEWGSQPEYWNQHGTMTDNKGSEANMTKNGTITGPA